MHDNGDFGGVLAIHGLLLFLPSSSFPWSGADNPGGGLARRTRRAEHRVVNGRNKEEEEECRVPRLQVTSHFFLRHFSDAILCKHVLNHNCPKGVTTSHVYFSPNGNEGMNEGGHCTAQSDSHRCSFSLRGRDPPAA